MSAELHLLKAELDEATHLFNQARQQEQFATAALCSMEMTRLCRLIMLEGEQQKQEQAWQPLPNIRPITTELAKFP